MQHAGGVKRRFSVLTARSFTMGGASSLGFSPSSGGVHTSPVFLCRAHKTPLVSQPFGRELGTHSPGSCGGHSRAQTNATNPSQSFATFALTPRSVMGALSCRSQETTAKGNVRGVRVRATKGEEDEEEDGEEDEEGAGAPQTDEEEEEVGAISTTTTTTTTRETQMRLLTSRRSPSSQRRRASS